MNDRRPSGSHTEDVDLIEFSVSRGSDYMNAKPVEFSKVYSEASGQSEESVILSPNHSAQYPNRKGSLSELFYLAREGSLEALMKRCSSASLDLGSIVDHQGWTLLHHAAWGGSVRVLKFLVDECGCDCTVADTSGWIPLHCAAQKRRKDAFSYLLELNTGTRFVKDKFGKMAEDYAGNVIDKSI